MESNAEEAENMTIVFTGSSIIPPSKLRRGMWLDVFSQRQTWEPAKVVRLAKDRMRVHFHDTSSKLDEWVRNVRFTRRFFHQGGWGFGGGQLCSSYPYACQGKSQSSMCVRR